MTAGSPGRTNLRSALSNVIGGIGVALIIVAGAVQGTGEISIVPFLIVAIISGTATYLRDRKSDEAKAWSDAVRLSAAVALGGAIVIVATLLFRDRLRSISPLGEQWPLVLIGGLVLMGLGAMIPRHTLIERARIALGIGALGAILLAFVAYGTAGLGSNLALVLLGVAAALVVAAYLIDRRAPRVNGPSAR